MSEHGEFWRDMKHIMKYRSQEKRESNYENAIRILQHEDIPHEEKANGHFVVKADDGSTYDFWATTGLYIQRKTQYRGRGIRNLVKRATKGRKYETRGE